MKNSAERLKRQQRRLDTQDLTISKFNPREKINRTDLGLTLLQRVAISGVCYSREEIAAWCGCTDGAILQIEQKAIKKLSNALQFRFKDLRRDLLIEFFSRSENALRVERGGAA